VIEAPCRRTIVVGTALPVSVSELLLKLIDLVIKLGVLGSKLGVLGSKLDNLFL
jgi:hypothetical protein